MDSQTIVAPMTPAGVSAVAALRVSGTRVRDVVSSLFGERAAKSLEPRRASLGIARDPKSGKLIDSLLYLFFEGPNSYTGEDVLELYPHGNPLIVRELLQVIRALDGVRLAEPGEFTRRAFLNGKMDLAQAESVADVIHSANRAELDVDFAEEEADPDFAGWETRFVAVRESIQKILESFHNKASLGRLPLAVLYGAPNAGKSSLVNALLGEDRILVSDIPGTTRDFVEVRLFLPGGEIRLVDTAGIADKAADALDALSMQKSREILEEADMKILVLDGAHASENDSHVIARERSDRSNLNPDLIVYSKSDLRASAPGQAEIAPCDALQVSSKTGEGLDALRTAINGRLFKDSGNSEDFWITSEREKSCLEEALAGVDRALDLLRNNPAVELLAFEMQVVRRALQSITGEISSEDILQSIFAGFCIGK